MTDERMKEMLESINIKSTDEAFLGSMPTGECTFIQVLDDVRTYEGNKWIPCQFKSGKEVYELSLKGLIRAEGLTYPTRNFQERAKMWMNGSLANKKFDWQGKVERKGIRKRKTDAGEAGSEYTLNVYTFGSKKVG